MNIKQEKYIKVTRRNLFGYTSLFCS